MCIIELLFSVFTWQISYSSAWSRSPELEPWTVFIRALVPEGFLLLWEPQVPLTLPFEGFSLFLRALLWLLSPAWEQARPASAGFTSQRWLLTRAQLTTSLLITGICSTTLSPWMWKPLTGLGRFKHGWQRCSFLSASLTRLPHLQLDVKGKRD